MSLNLTLARSEKKKVCFLQEAEVYLIRDEPRSWTEYVVMHQANGKRFMVYQSKYAGTYTTARTQGSVATDWGKTIEEMLDNWEKEYTGRGWAGRVSEWPKWVNVTETYGHKP